MLMTAAALAGALAVFAYRLNRYLALHEHVVAISGGSVDMFACHKRHIWRYVDNQPPSMDAVNNYLLQSAVDMLN